MSKIGKVLRFQFSHLRMSKMLLLIYWLGWLSLFYFFMTNLAAQNNIYFLSHFCKSEAWVCSTMSFVQSIISLKPWCQSVSDIIWSSESSFKLMGHGRIQFLSWVKSETLESLLLVIQESLSDPEGHPLPCHEAPQSQQWHSESFLYFGSLQIPLSVIRFKGLIWLVQAHPNNTLKVSWLEAFITAVKPLHGNT